MSDKEKKSKNAEYQRKYYWSHHEKIRQQRKFHNINKESKKIRDTKDHKKHREKRLAKLMNRYWQRRSLIDKVSLHYGCQNKKCCWQGEFHACQLDFHHLYPKQKTKEVSLIICCKLSKIAAEINKCIILCRCCHSLLHSGIDLSLTAEMLCKVDDTCNPI